MRYQLDVRGLLCPIPVIRTQNRIKELSVDDELEIHATDPGVLNDVPAWSRINGHDVLNTHNEDGEVTVLLKVGEQEDTLF